MTQNPFELANRQRKAQAVADLLIVTQENTNNTLPLSRIAENMEPAIRDLFAMAAGQHTPSDDTWQEVVRIIRQHEANVLRARSIA